MNEALVFFLILNDSKYYSTERGTEWFKAEALKGVTEKTAKKPSLWGYRTRKKVHTVDALAVGGEEGRVSLRKASGSWHKSDNPKIPEWGNPATWVVITDWIHRSVKRTWGTETSKYPEEKKSTEILWVAASESGRAQLAKDAVSQKNVLESTAIEGESPVFKNSVHWANDE